MADTYSFDVVSRIDMQEMKNVVDQTLKEIGQRYDFKGSKSELTLKEKEKLLVVQSDDDYKLNAVLDILKTKCVKRNVSLKGLTYGKVEEALGGTDSLTTKPKPSRNPSKKPNSKRRGKFKGSKFGCKAKVKMNYKRS
jgi:uncharacterized protein YajQ (UPF0234 family)